MSVQISSYELFRRLAAGHAYIPNRKHLIPSRSLATSEVDTLYLGTAKGVSEDKAVSLMSVGIDFGVTQVVDGNWSIHAILKKSLFAGGEIYISLPTPGPLVALWLEPAQLWSPLAGSLPGSGCLAGTPGDIGPAYTVGYWTES